MIKNFSHKGLERFFTTGSKAGIQAKHAKKLNLQLAALNTAFKIEDMDLPNWQLHSLKGSRKDTWSISVSGNWRMTFEFIDGDARVVDYEDYH